MKNYLIIPFIFFCHLTFAQFQIESNFNVVGTGRNQSLLVNYKFDKLQIGIGPKYHINKPNNFPQSVFYKKTFFSTTSSEHWGTDLNLKYRLFDVQDVFVAHVFYSNQFTKSHIRFETHFALDKLVENPTSEFDYSYIKHESEIGPILAVENNIGIAFEIFLLKNIYLSQKFGVGIMFYKNLDENNQILALNNWVFTEMLSFGIGYKFNEKVK